MDYKLDLLAIGAHPDDVEMTSGGWLSLAQSQGHSTGIIHLTRGEMGSHGTPEKRQQEAEAAAQILEVNELHFAGLVDGHLRDDDESVNTLVGLLRKLKPRVVIAPYFSCHHPDHEAAARMCVKAVHYASLKGYGHSLERHAVQRLVHATYSRRFDASFFVDISEHIERKLASIMAYQSQVVDSQPSTGESPLTRLSRPGFAEQLIAGSASIGLRVACDHAEAYFTQTGLILSDPVALFSQGPTQNMIR